MVLSRQGRDGGDRLDLQTTHIRTAFTLSLGLGIVFFALSWLAAPLFAVLLGLEDLLVDKGKFSTSSRGDP